MASKIRGLMIFLIACFLGTLYAGLLGLVTYPLRASLISWPVWIILFWFLADKFNLPRSFAILLLVLPLSILSFEITRTIIQPPTYAFQLLSLDRSHYRPRTRVINRKFAPSGPESPPSAVRENLDRRRRLSGRS